MNSGNNSEVKSQMSEVESQTQDRESLHRGNRPVLFYITDTGRVLAEKISRLYPESQVLKYSPGLFAEQWSASKALICIMAAGIAVRAIAPLLKDKRSDPAVVVLDEKGEYAVSLLSGHIGGANAFAREIAGYLGAQAVITTASDVQGKVALDLWAMEHDLYVEDYQKLKALSTRIVNGGKVQLMAECPVDTQNLPVELELADQPEKADIIISERVSVGKALFLRPRNLFGGIGCNRGTGSDEIREFIMSVCEDEGLSFHSIGGIATIDMKRDEAGLIDFARDNGLHIDFFSKDELNREAEAQQVTRSEVVMTATGAVAVAEPAALLCAKKYNDSCAIIRPKLKRGNVTFAIARADFTL